MATESACLLIADISGYTGYLAGVEIDHAQDILADLTTTIVSALRPGFRLAKLEGDAAFTYAIMERIDGSLLLDAIERCYFGFRRRRRDVRQATSCDCNACVRIPDLNLKFVVHHGTILRQRVAGREEMLGSDVIVVHRLLKNTVVEATGIEAYALFSQGCVDAMDVDVEALGMRSLSETYDHIGTVPVWVHDLERRWAEEESRTRVIVDADTAIKEIAIATTAPAQVAWEFVTAPGRRVSWQVGVTGVEMVATGNRRGIGATNHCLHGADASYRGAARLAPVRLLHVPEHDPDAERGHPHARDHRFRADPGGDDRPLTFRGPEVGQGARPHAADGVVPRSGDPGERRPADPAARGRARARPS